jgi:predicted kinase
MVGTLHFICGRLASGKTTLAREIVKASGAVLLCEDVWLSKLSDGIRTFDDYLTWSRRCRSVMGPLIVDILRSGSSVVLDFAGNTPSERAWIRTLFEEAGAPHILHCLTVSEEVCLQRLKHRNKQKPEGIFFAETSEADFFLITSYFQLPQEEENFHVKFY